MLNFRSYPNLTRVSIPNNVSLSTGNMSNAFSDMENLIVSDFNHPNITNMAYAYANCIKLTGSPVCGPNVTYMAYAY